MIRATDVEAREGRRIWLRYSDGATGEVDLSHLNGRGVFAAWNDADRFGTVRIASHGAIAWGDDLELCPDALYVALTGRSVEDIMPGALRDTLLPKLISGKLRIMSLRRTR